MSLIFLFKFHWRLQHGSSYLERGRESRLVIDNVTYDYQGEYQCRATNYINGQERHVTSEPISLQVVGAPLVLRSSPAASIVPVRKGEAAHLSLVVCADPRPRHVAWEWGSMRLEAGNSFGKYCGAAEVPSIFNEKLMVFLVNRSISRWRRNARHSWGLLLGYVAYHRNRFAWFTAVLFGGGKWSWNWSTRCSLECRGYVYRCI